MYTTAARRPFIKPQTFQECWRELWSLEVTDPETGRLFNIKGPGDTLFLTAWTKLEFPELQGEEMPPLGEYCREADHTPLSRSRRKPKMSTFLFFGAAAYLAWIFFPRGLGFTTIFLGAIFVPYVIYQVIKSIRVVLYQIPRTPAAMLASGNKTFRADFLLMPLSARDLYVSQYCVNMARVPSPWQSSFKRVLLLLGVFLAIFAGAFIRAMAEHHDPSVTLFSVSPEFYWHALLGAVSVGTVLALVHFVSRCYREHFIMLSIMGSVMQSIHQVRAAERIKRMKRAFAGRFRWYTIIAPLRWRTLWGRPWQKLRNSARLWVRLPFVLFTLMLSLATAAIAVLGLSDRLGAAGLVLMILWLFFLVALSRSPVVKAYHKASRFTARLQFEKFEELIAFHKGWLRREINKDELSV